MAKPSLTVNLQLTHEADARLRAFCGETRVKKAVLARLIEWFAAQPAPVQRVVMGEAEGMEEDHARALEHLAAQVRSSMPTKPGSHTKPSGRRAIDLADLPETDRLNRRSGN